jgi:hypothetical protein
MENEQLPFREFCAGTVLIPGKGCHEPRKGLDGSVKPHYGFAPGVFLF